MLADGERSRDASMALLQSIINHVLLENKVCPEYRDGLEEDMEMWVEKSTELNVRMLGFIEQNRDADTGLSSPNLLM